MTPAGRKLIRVTVSAFGPATRYVKPGTYELKPGAKVKALLKKAGLTDKRLPLIFMIDGQRVDRSRPLADGEDLKVLTIAGGG
jgi:hypothetical protein